jgi:glyoxylase-like metal-dependent hydrolase (beta-lactamase superfamily II)
VTGFVLGDLRISVLDAGRIWLDGGAMFGVVPKVLWERERTPDPRNRIELAMNLLLVEDGRCRVLVDTGAGERWDARARDVYRLEPRPPEAYLGAAGVRPDQVDLVLHTHLHFDHAGGNTVERGGALAPAFANAEHVVQSGEIEFARQANERTRGSYRAGDFEPLAAAGRLRGIDGDRDVTPHVSVRRAPGHTPHHQIPLVRAGGRTLAFLGDLVPTASHAPYPYIMGYDVEPLATLRSKKAILPEAVREGWILVLQHDARLPVGVLEESGGRLRLRPETVEG